jgi:hypothetical protein
MKKFIEKTVNPPGINKKNRGAIFSLIGSAGDKVKADAEKAFNAHFPYITDGVKLAEHGIALSIPRFENDSEKEFRDRVAAASFFLTKKGERGYILDQLAGHFGERFDVAEEFLRIWLKVRDLTENEKKRAYGFLDGVTDPNILLALTTVENCLDPVRLLDAERNLKVKVRHTLADKSRALDAAPGFNLKGFGYSDVFELPLLLDGTWLLDGNRVLNGRRGEIAFELLSFAARAAARETAAMRDSSVVFVRRDITENVTAKEGAVTAGSGPCFREAVAAPLLLDGTWLLDGNRVLNGRTDEPAIERLSFAVCLDAGDIAAMPDASALTAVRQETAESVTATETGRARLGLAEKTERFDTPTEIFTAGIRNRHYLDGKWLLDGTVKLNGIMFEPLGWE